MPTLRRGLATFEQMMCEIVVGPKMSGCAYDVFLDLQHWENLRLFGLRVGVIRTDWSAPQIKAQLNYDFPDADFHVAPHYRRLQFGFGTAPSASSD